MCNMHYYRTRSGAVYYRIKAADGEETIRVGTPLDDSPVEEHESFYLTGEGLISIPAGQAASAVPSHLRTSLVNDHLYFHTEEGEVRGHSTTVVQDCCIEAG